jgi:hypothetical protein
VATLNPTHSRRRSGVNSVTISGVGKSVTLGAAPEAKSEDPKSEDPNVQLGSLESRFRQERLVFGQPVEFRGRL